MRLKSFSAFAFVMCALALLAGCASYPTQELSDARQAIRAAEEVGANKQFPEIFNKASDLLTKAESELNDASPKFSDAKSKAIAAKQEAVKARHLTVAIQDAEKTIAKLENENSKLSEAKQALAKAMKAIEQDNFEEAMKFSELAKNLAIQGR